MTTNEEQAKRVLPPEWERSGKGVFDDFIAHNRELYPATGKGKRGRLSDRSAQVYRSFWMSCVRFVGERRGKQWHEASVDDVEAFLVSIRARSRGSRNKQGDVVGRHSMVTRQRYETVLSRVYGFAASKNQDVGSYGNLRVNPVRLTVTDEFPRRENAGSFVLHQGYRNQIVRGIRTNSEGHEARDDAAIALMACQGLTPKELQGFRCSDVGFEEDALPEAGWHLRQERWPEAPTPSYILVRSVGAIERTGQARRLTLDPISKAALRNWLEWRGPHINASNHDLVLCTPRGPVSSTLLYEMAKAHLSRTLLRSAQGQGLSLLHMGPMTLRNTALLDWLERERDVDEVMRKGGFSHIKSLLRFVQRVASEEARQRLMEAMTRVEEEPEATAGTAAAEV